MRTRLHAAAIAALAVTLAIAAPAVAVKGGNGNGHGGNGTENGNGNENEVAQSSSISLNESGQSLAFGDSVTFTTSAAGLNGTEYPLVYVECRSVVDGSLLYGQLDHPDTAFVLGGGSSRWWDVRDDANCLAHLYSYGGKDRGNDVILELTSPHAFDAAA